MPKKLEVYNNSLLPEDQIDAEEMIAAMIFDYPNVAIHDNDAKDLGERILKGVLLKFRPDLFD